MIDIFLIIDYNIIALSNALVIAAQAIFPCKGNAFAFQKMHIFSRYCVKMCIFIILLSIFHKNARYNAFLYRLVIKKSKKNAVFLRKKHDLSVFSLFYAIFLAFSLDKRYSIDYTYNILYEGDSIKRILEIHR